eukprot:Nitzschia sp. Nitz4//scaffold309_size21490//8451//12430//NITZ4_008610-RA/size21490-augustus-gene-0.0-mRNA-1//1//CDS//3329547177//6044//frame0
MGCNQSTPEVVVAPAARTETKGTWDSDFCLTPTESIAPTVVRKTKTEKPVVFNPHAVQPIAEAPSLYGPSGRVEENDVSPPLKPDRGARDIGHVAPKTPTSPRVKKSPSKRPPLPKANPHRPDTGDDTSQPAPPSPVHVRPDLRTTASQLPLPNANQAPREGTFQDYYIEGAQLGKGAFANVFVGIEKSTQKRWAVKHILDRKKMIWNGRDALVDELVTLEKLRFAPNVVYMHDHFVDKTSCYLVLELLPGKELFDHLIQRGTFTEGEARDSCRCILEALKYMHERRVTHRDLKPENILLADAARLFPVKLSDFGFSKTIRNRNECRTLCGTPGYLAPEILERWPAYDVKVDVWSFGVILFLLLGGYLPFDSPGDNDVKRVFERTRNGQYYFYPQRWQPISSSAKELVGRCLTINPNHRISAEEALLHPWLATRIPLPNKQISAVDLADTMERTKVQGQQKKPNDHAQRVQELNDDFTVFLGERQGDSIVSHFVGGPKSTRSASMSTATSAFPDDSSSGKPFAEFYDVGELLGSGGFATVYRCTYKRTGMSFAVKEVDHTKLNEKEKAILKDEIVVLQFLRGVPYIIRLYDVFREQNRTLMILEEMKGGDLLSRIVEKDVYTEREARQLCKALFHAVNFCHKKRIAHRDIKLDNLLLQEKGNDASLKLADFGFAKKVPKPQENGTQILLKTLCGTPSYMAPEIFWSRKVGYDFRCDMWSVGIVVFALLGGYLPFDGDTKTIAQRIYQEKISFHPEYWKETSTSAKKLIEGFLEKDVDKRVSAEQALESRWMSLDDGALSALDLSVTKSKLAGMSGKKKVQAVVRGIIGVNKLQAQYGLANDVSDDDALLSINEEEVDDDMDFELEFTDVYEMNEEPGNGIFSKFRVATALTGKQEYSVKKIVRRELHPGDLVALNDEIEVLQAIKDCDSKSVACLHEVYEDPDATYLVFEKLSGQVLIERLIQQRKYTEFDAKELIRSLLLGVSHCHSKRIAIRNLTLDNLLLPEGKESRIIITDFEFSKRVIFSNSLRTQCGTQEFVAPEVLENRPAYDVSCDMWSVGVILFIMLGGYYPFRGRTDEEKLRNVRYGIFEFRPELWSGVTEDAKDLLRRMMTVNPEDRVSANDALSSEWMEADDRTLDADLSENVQELRHEMGHKLKAAVNAIMAKNKLEQLLAPPAGRRGSMAGYQVDL